jgi:hypothetical protein
VRPMRMAFINFSTLASSCRSFGSTSRRDAMMDRALAGTSGCAGRPYSFIADLSSIQPLS